MKEMPVPVAAGSRQQSAQAPAFPEQREEQNPRGLGVRFQAGRLYALRAAVAAHGMRLGLTGAPLGTLLVVATELATNVIRHGGGEGSLRLYREGEFVACEVKDRGPGIANPSLAGSTQVAPTSGEGRGLWIVRQFTSDLRIDSSPSGTTITAMLPANRPAEQDA